MKIDQLNKGLPLDKNDKCSRTKSTPTLDFQQMLNDRIHQSIAPESITSTTSICRSPVSPQLKTEGLVLTESTIDTLDSFAEALQNTHFSAAELEPYVSALEDETLALLNVRDQLPANDGLAALLNRVATVSYVETVKFRRGDYN